ncbi:hypothetical protein [uncultured Nostoc sp.]|uniref:hypothetical protein n=1 Tax=uncultured Nostoc sp. TaxID=340711 RepID=UPI0035CC17E9
MYTELSSELSSAIALITVNNPELNNLPPIKLIALDAETASLSGRTASTRPPTDIRWVKVLEFLRSNNLAPNSRKLYERELKRFLAWRNGTKKSRNACQIKITAFNQ